MIWWFCLLGFVLFFFYIFMLTKHCHASGWYYHLVPFPYADHVKPVDLVLDHKQGTEMFMSPVWLL